MTTIVGWGASPWGGSAWGGALGGVQALNAALAIRENVVRVAFAVPVYVTGILDPQDGGDPRHYALSPVAGTIGLDGEVVRPASIVETRVPSAVRDGIAVADEGRFIDLVLDRPLSAVGALYDLTVSGIWSADLTTMITSASARVDGLYRALVPPQVDVPLPARDFANAQLGQPGADDPPVGVEDPALGTLRIDDSGDYAFDEGIASLRKRILRRFITRKNGFAHLPGYGVGVLQLGKRLAVASSLAAVSADAEAQIAREPDVAKVRVLPLVDPRVPGLVRFQITVRPKVGPAHRFNLAFSTQA
jgi:hypothetical protein